MGGRYVHSPEHFSTPSRGVDRSDSGAMPRDASWCGQAALARSLASPFAAGGEHGTPGSRLSAASLARSGSGPPLERASNRRFRFSTEGRGTACRSVAASPKTVTRVCSFSFTCRCRSTPSSPLSSGAPVTSLREKATAEPDVGSLASFRATSPACRARGASARPPANAGAASGRRKLQRAGA